MSSPGIITPQSQIRSQRTKIDDTSPPTHSVAAATEKRSSFSDRPQKSWKEFFDTFFKRISLNPTRDKWPYSAAQWLHWKNLLTQHLGSRHVVSILMFHRKYCILVSHSLHFVPTCFRSMPSLFNTTQMKPEWWRCRCLKKVTNNDCDSLVSCK